eukprot:TRINITY_DN486_c0_g1_i1.p1 TRINITY_DN486_c0_g1~~TRINITY_DN486_c0_g1_i1.p1  ORF type:complete len:113 (+),score=3.00 TRINITY_DN486_c0_g1_i1:103-441(+)
MGINHCNLFYGTWYSYTLPATLFWKTWMNCCGAGRNICIVILRALLYLLYFPFILIGCIFLFIVGIFSDILCCIIWSITCGCCCKEGECGRPCMERCCQATNDTQPILTCCV